MWIHEYTSEQNNPFKEAPFLRILRMCYVDNLPRWSYPYHTHADSFEVAWIMTGQGEIHMDQRREKLYPGSIAVIPPMVSHYFSNEKGSGMTYYSIRFSALPEDAASELQKSYMAAGPAVGSSKGYTDKVSSLIQLLCQLHEANGGFVDQTFQASAFSLLQLSYQLLKDTISTGTALTDEEHETASRILNHIMATDGKGVTLESLAKEFNLSPSHLSRIFSGAYHISPINYAIGARISMATEYLLNTDMSVAEIAEEVGYGNPTHFSNMFFKRIGCTPTEFREWNQSCPITRQPDQDSN